MAVRPAAVPPWAIVCAQASMSENSAFDMKAACRVLCVPIPCGVDLFLVAEIPIGIVPNDFESMFQILGPTQAKVACSPTSTLRSVDEEAGVLRQVSHLGAVEFHLAGWHLFRLWAGRERAIVETPLLVVFADAPNYKRGMTVFPPKPGTIY